MKFLLFAAVTCLVIMQVRAQDMSGNAFSDSQSSPFNFNFATDSNTGSSTGSSSAFDFGGSSSGSGASSPPQPTAFNFGGSTNNAPPTNQQSPPATNNQITFPSNVGNPPQPQNNGFPPINQPAAPNTAFGNQGSSNIMNQNQPGQPIGSPLPVQGQNSMQGPMSMQGQGQVQPPRLNSGPGGFALGTNQLAMQQQPGQQGAQAQTPFNGMPPSFAGPPPQLGRPLGNQQPSMNVQPPTMNRQPSMLNGQPTLNRQPPTLNRQPPTLNRQPPTLNGQPPSLNGQPPVNTFLNFGVPGNDAMTFRDGGLPTGTIDNIRFGARPSREPFSVTLGQFDFGGGQQQPRLRPPQGQPQAQQPQQAPQPVMGPFDQMNFGNQLPGVGPTLFSAPGFSGLLPMQPDPNNNLFGGFGSAFGGNSPFGFSPPPRRQSWLDRLLG